MHYFANSEENIKAMLGEIGVSELKEILKSIPEDALFAGDFDIPALTENELVKHFNDLAEHNGKLTVFAGGGSYDHYIPAAIQHIILRSEFYTAYTPYQPEVSQGTLQAIYEYQTLLSRITGMEVVNASMYDGGTALAEAILMALQAKGKKRIVIPENINPRYLDIVKTYLSDMDVDIHLLKCEEGTIDLASLEKAVDDDTAAVVMQNPNFYGLIEDGIEISQLVHGKNALLIVSVNPASLSVLTPPGEYDADIVVGEGQPLGIPVSFGGPYLGIFAAKKQYIRKMPGRIIGMTEDIEGKRGFVMVVQTREQHIRREKATSNICTNSGLMALISTVYLTMMGETGFKKVGENSMANAHYLAEQLTAIPGVSLRYDKPFFNEFLLNTSIEPGVVMEKMAEAGILAGIGVTVSGKEPGLLVAVTEKRTKEEMDNYVHKMKEIF